MEMCAYVYVPYDVESDATTKDFILQNHENHLL